MSGNGSGGGGTWDTTSANWYNGTTDVVWNNANNDTAVFECAPSRNIWRLAVSALSEKASGG
jgi:hypothetical protein